MSGSAICGSARPAQRSPAAKRSGSNSRPNWPRRATGRTLYILDEPTTGLHFADIEKLLQVLMKLRDAGNTLVVIEHNLEMIKCADWIIDLGPEGGARGGAIVGAGTPEEIAAVEESYTGPISAAALKGMKETPNSESLREQAVQRSTFNVQLKRSIQLLLLLASLALCSLGRGEQAAELLDAAQPLAEGVPEVAVVRLRALLAREISSEERQAATVKAGRSPGSFRRVCGSFADSGRGQLPMTRRRQSFSRRRPVRVYRAGRKPSRCIRCAQRIIGSPFRADALFGQAEVAARPRANRTKHSQTLDLLRRDERWRRRAEMRSVEMLVEAGDTAGSHEVA